RIEPEAVELVAEIVVMTNVAPRAHERVGPRCPERQPFAPRNRRVDRYARNGLDDRGEVATHIDALGAIQLAILQIRIQEDREERAAIANQEVACPCAARMSRRPVPQLDADPRWCNRSSKSRGKPAIT